MKKDLLLEDLASLLNVDKSRLHDAIYLQEELYWDSLSVVSTVAAVQHHYGIAVNAAELMACETIADIFFLIEVRAQ